MTEANKNFKIIKTYYREWVVAANSKEEALNKIASGEIEVHDKWQADQAEVIEIENDRAWLIKTLP